MNAIEQNTSANIQIAGIDWQNQHGPLEIRMTNDYLFRTLLQENNLVLKALIASLLHMERSEIISAVIRNPISLGKHIDEKDYYLDVNVTVNGNRTVNLEMQVINQGNWQNRSLVYLCRNFDSLNKGDEYEDLITAIHIGLLDFTLFSEEPEFYASYYLINEKTGRKYSDKFRISVLDLTQIAIASEEDQHYGIDNWARFFKAKTWEELHMLEKSDPIFEEAASTIYQVSKEEDIRLRCMAREDYYRTTVAREKKLQKLDEQVNQLISEKEQLSSRNEQLSLKNEQLNSRNEQLADELERANALLRKHGLIP